RAEDAGLQGAAVTPGGGGRGLEAPEEDLGVGGLTLGEEQPRQGEVLVLPQVGQRLVDRDAGVPRPAGRQVGVARGEGEAGADRRDGTQVWVEAGPVELLGPVEQPQRTVEV